MAQHEQIDALQKPDQFGLVNRARQPQAPVNPAPANPTQPDPIKTAPIETAQPVMSQVNPQTDTIAGRISAITGKDSKFMQVQDQKAREVMNSRGLINSSMTVGAIEKARIDAATPIAARDAQTYSQTRLENQRTQNQFLSNEQSAQLNKDVAKFSNDIKLKSDKIMNDERLSSQVKLNYTTAIKEIQLDSQKQIADIGLSDRSAEAQASAIVQVGKNRDAQVKVYQDLLSSFPDWKWGTEFTPQ